VLTAQPGSTFGLSISAGVLGSGSNSGAVMGSLGAVRLNDPWDHDSGVIVGDLRGDFAVADFTVTGLLLGLLEVKDLFLTVSTPAGLVVGGPNPYTVDLAGSSISVTSGRVILGGSTLFNFGWSPLVAVAPAGTNTMLDWGAYETDGRSFWASVGWTVPFTTLRTLSTFGVPVNLTINTNFVLSGDWILIPEPGRVLLIGAGLAGLVLAGRRKAA